MLMTNSIQKMKAKQNTVFQTKHICGCMAFRLSVCVLCCEELLAQLFKYYWLIRRYTCLFLSHGNSELFLEFIGILATSRSALSILRADSLYFILFWYHLMERLRWMERRHLLRFLAGRILSMPDQEECIIVSVPEGRGLDQVTFDVHFSHVIFRFNQSWMQCY